MSTMISHFFRKLSTGVSTITFTTSMVRNRAVKAQIPKVFLNTRHVGHSCIIAVRGRCCTLNHSWTNNLRSLLCNNVISGLTVAQQQEPGVPVLSNNDSGYAGCLPRRKNSTDMYGPYGFLPSCETVKNTKHYAPPEQNPGKFSTLS
jgi:hypothetical protein